MLLSVAVSKLDGWTARLGVLAIVLLASVSLVPAAGAATLLSDNWAGYVAAAGANVGSRFSSVSGTWRQPAASCTAGRETFSAVWVGLGGYAEGGRALEQIGTAADCTRSGRAAYAAWFELLPADPVQIRLPARPGERIAASVTTKGSHVTLRMRNLTTGARFSTTRHYAHPDVSTAEWIVEAPSRCTGAGGCTALALADFGTVSFEAASASARGHTGAILDAGWSASALELQQSALSRAPQGLRAGAARTVTTARPSASSGSGGSFSVTWSQRSTQAPAPPRPPSFG